MEDCKLHGYYAKYHAFPETREPVPCTCTPESKLRVAVYAIQKAIAYLEWDNAGHKERPNHGKPGFAECRGCREERELHKILDTLIHHE